MKIEKKRYKDNGEIVTTYWVETSRGSFRLGSDEALELLKLLRTEINIDTDKT